MVPVRVVVETRDGVAEFVVHVNNRSQHSLRGAVRAAWRKYPAAKSVTAQFTEHDCATCARSHATPTMRRVFHRVPKKRTA